MTNEAIAHRISLLEAAKGVNNYLSQAAKAAGYEGEAAAEFRESVLELLNEEDS